MLNREVVKLKLVTTMVVMNCMTLCFSLAFFSVHLTFQSGKCNYDIYSHIAKIVTLDYANVMFELLVRIQALDCMLN